MSLKQSFVSVNSFIIYLNITSGLWMSNLASIIPSFAGRVAVYVFNICSDVCVNLAFLSFLFYQLFCENSVFDRCCGVFITIVTFQSVVKSTYFFVYRKQFGRLIETWEESNIRGNITDNGARLSMIERRKVKQLSIVSLIVLASPAVIFDSACLFPSIQELHGGRFIPVPGYFPYNALNSPWFEFTIAFVTAAGWLMMARIVAFDAFFFTLTSQQIVLLKDLNIRLEELFNDLSSFSTKHHLNVHQAQEKKKLVRFRLKDRLSRNKVAVQAPEIITNCEQPPNPDVDYSETITSTETEELLKARVKLWVMHHQEVIRMVADIDELYSPILLLQFFTSILILCFTAFVAVEMDSLDKMQKFAVQLSVVGFSGHLFVMCLYGDQIAHESVSLSDAGLANGWQHCKVKEVLTSLKIIYHRTQIPLQISAFGVFPLSSETFLGIMRIALSYLTFLIDIKTKV